MGMGLQCTEDVAATPSWMDRAKDMVSNAGKQDQLAQKDPLAQKDQRQSADAGLDEWGQAAAEGGQSTGAQPDGPAELGDPDSAFRGGAPEVSGWTPAGWGKKLASHRGVPAYGNGPDPEFSPSYAVMEHGYAFQCVEYANRFMATVHGTGNLKGTGHAKSYANRGDGGLTWVDNGPGKVPQESDIIVFSGGKYGHIGVVSAAGPGGVTLVHQNWGSSGTASLSVSEGGVGSLGGYRVVGWQSAGEDGAKVDLDWNRKAFVATVAGGLGLPEGDPDSAWSEALKKGIITSDRPNEAITRGAAAAIVSRALNLQSGAPFLDLSTPTFSVPFADVSAGDWFARDAALCRAFGIFRGGSDNQFRGAEAISQAEAELVAGRLGGSVGLTSTEQQRAHLSAEPMVGADEQQCLPTDSHAGTELVAMPDLQQVTASLGEVDGLGYDLAAVAGGLMDRYLPTIGASVELDCWVTLATVGAGRVGVAFGGEAERTDKGVALGGSIEVLGVVGADLGLFRALVEARFGGYFDAFGDSATEAFHLIGFGVHQSLEAAGRSGRWAADQLFPDVASPAGTQAPFENYVLANMDDDDRVALGGQLSVSGETKGGVMPGKTAEAELGLQLRAGAEWTKAGMGDAQGIQQAVLSGSLDVPKIGGVAGQATFTRRDGVYDGFAGKFSVQKEMPVLSLFTPKGMVANFAAGIATSVYGFVMQSRSDLDANSVQQVSAITDDLLAITSIDLARMVLTEELMKKGANQVDAWVLQGVPTDGIAKAGIELGVNYEKNPSQKGTFTVYADVTKALDFEVRMLAGLDFERGKRLFHYTL